MGYINPPNIQPYLQTGFGVASVGLGGPSAPKQTAGVTGCLGGKRQVTETEIVLVIDCFCCCICCGKLTKIPCKSLATIFLVRLVYQFHMFFLVEVYHAKGSPPFLKMVATTSRKYLASTIEVQHRSIIGNKHPRDSIYGVFTYICLNLGKYTI